MSHCCIEFIHYAEQPTKAISLLPTRRPIQHVVENKTSMGSNNAHGALHTEITRGKLPSGTQRSQQLIVALVYKVTFVVNLRCTNKLNSN